MYAGPGAKILDSAIANGIQTRRRNPKGKARLPYHAKKHLSPNIMGGKDRKCPHGLARHEEVVLKDVGKVVTASYALPCKVAHRTTTKNPIHKDIVGRKWQ